LKNDLEDPNKKEIISKFFIAINLNHGACVDNDGKLIFDSSDEKAFLKFTSLFGYTFLDNKNNIWEINVNGKIES